MAHIFLGDTHKLILPSHLNTLITKLVLFFIDVMLLRNDDVLEARNVSGLWLF